MSFSFTRWSDLEIAVDGELIATIESDRLACGSVLGRLERWDLSSLLKREITTESPATFDEMMPLWVGNLALNPIEPSRLEAYTAFLEPFGCARRFREVAEALARDRGAMLECDLGPVHDMVLIEAHQKELAPDRIPIILEIGGGYGRLAELFHLYGKLKYRYIIVDGVPESIYYSWSYLRHRLPDATVGFHYAGDRFDAQSFEIFVGPSWRLDEIIGDPLDVAINVSSIQEMPDETVAAYFDYMARAVTPGGFVFLENSRDFFHKREYIYPATWKYLTKVNSPRSRTLDHPVEVLQVTESDQAAHNKAVVEEYYIQLKSRVYQTMETQIAKRDATVQRLRKANDLSRTAVDTLTARLERAHQQRESLKTKLEQHKQRLQKS